jgi:hypothetical protein
MWAQLNILIISTLRDGRFVNLICFFGSSERSCRCFSWRMQSLWMARASFACIFRSPASLSIGAHPRRSKTSAAAKGHISAWIYPANPPSTNSPHMGNTSWPGITTIESKIVTGFPSPQTLQGGLGPGSSPPPTVGSAAAGASVSSMAAHPQRDATKVGASRANVRRKVPR